MKISALAHQPASGPVELLYLLFHGAGADARSMHPLVQRLAQAYPQAAVVSINAPDPFDGTPSDGEAYQWFSQREVSEALLGQRVDAVLPAFVATVRQMQQHFSVDWERTALVGFGQGALMALEAVQAEERLAGRVLSFSGRHASLPTHAPESTTVHLFHGMADTVVPPGPAVAAARQLVQLGGDVTADILPGVGHELSPALLDKAIHQLSHFIPARLWREAQAAAPE